jgi:hypothetical protein
MKTQKSKLLIELDAAIALSEKPLPATVPLPFHQAQNALRRYMLQLRKKVISP